MRKKASNKLLVFLAVSCSVIIALAGALYFQTRQNIRSREIISSLEKSLAALNAVSEKEFEAVKLKRQRLEEDSLDYLQWMYVLKDQVKLAKDKLNGYLNSKASRPVKERELIGLLYFNLGLSNMLAADFQAAIEAFESAVKKNNKDYFCYYNLGLLYSTFGANPKKALQNYKKFLEFAPPGEYTEKAMMRIAVILKDE